MNSVILWFSFFVGCASAAKLPAIFDACPINPEMDKCIERAIEKSLKNLVKGYQPLGILPMDPLEIIAIDIDQGTGPVSINLKFRDLRIIGISTTKIRNFKSNLKNLTFTAKAFIPKITLTGPYKINGKVLILPISGDGQSRLVVEDVTADVVLQGKHFKKDNVRYMRITNFSFIMSAKKLGISLTNLFGGDKALGDNMNRFLNENSIEILNELKPAIQDTFGAAFGEISNRIFTKIPFDEIFHE